MNEKNLDHKDDKTTSFWQRFSASNESNISSPNTPKKGGFIKRASTNGITSIYIEYA